MIRPTNLNFLRMFDAVMRTRSVSKAANDVGITQPALSNALAKLRIELNDPLFVRSRNGIEPTPFALDYHPAVVQALKLLSSAQERSGQFDPDHDRRTFRIAMSDIAEAVILPRIMAGHFRDRDNLSIITQPMPEQEITDALERGLIDLAVGFIEKLTGPLIRQTLFRTDYVCLTPKGLCVDERSRFILVDANGTGHAAVAKTLPAQAVAVRTPHFLALPHIVRASGIPAIVPRPLGTIFADWLDLAIQPSPIALPQIDIVAAAHMRVREDPANMWLREAFRSTFADVDWSAPVA
jgi:DNA-binding transcriptional LysR family regulator